MTDPVTPNIGLTKPTVGADNNAWGGVLNTNCDVTDALWVNIGNVAFGTAATKALSFFIQASNNLSDLSNATTARTNLGLGTAATQATGTSGATVPLLNGANTWSAAQTFSGGLSGALTGNASTATTATTANAVAAGSVAPAGLSTGHPTWDGSGNVTTAGNLVVIGNGGEMFDTGTSFVVQFRAGCYIQYDSSTHKFVWVIDGVAQMSLDNGGNLRCVGTVIINTAV